jgi:predicted metal-dependent phosphoesterase TrpH
MEKTDLHVHSIHSDDGELGIRTLIQSASDKGIITLSITDHNSVGGIREAIRECGPRGIILIPGIEIDCTYKGINLHLLGYHVNWEHEDFETLEKEVQKIHMDLFPEMARNLEKLGIDVDREEVLRRAGGKPPTGELIAEVLLSGSGEHEEWMQPFLNGGSRSDNPYLNFYLDYFAPGKEAHVKITYMPFRDALVLVRDHGGTPVVAHPGLNFRGREEMVRELIEMGTMGLEVFNNYHNPAQIDYFANLAVKEQVLITCGSDFHGKNKPSIQLGEYMVDHRFLPHLEESIIQLKK